ncbi:MAG: hypothetical protein EON52_01180 [Actinomycetales bacterium]|nr:MAG: hypothetical protein EON52_01180 [Actinomycetales bacterium]
MKMLVWINPDSNAKVHPETDSPGEGWEHVGFVDSMAERDIVTQVQARLGHRSTPARRTDFYLCGDRQHPWVQSTTAATKPFAVAIDPDGDGTYLAAFSPARTVSLARRAPEPPPGLLERPVLVPIRLTTRSGRLFL